MEFLKDILLFIKHRKRYWLIPLILALLLLGLLILSVEMVPVLPAIYPVI